MVVKEGEARILKRIDVESFKLIAALSHRLLQLVVQQVTLLSVLLEIITAEPSRAPLKEFTSVDEN